MATSSPPLVVLLLLLLSVAAAARPCKTLFYFSATTTTTTFYPNRNSLPEDVNPNYILRDLSPRYLTLVFTSSTANRFPESRPSINFDARGEDSQPSDLPVKFYSSVSSSVRDRTKDLMSVVGALLFGVGCGAFTAAVMYLVWALFTPARRFDYEDVSSSSDDDDDTDDVAAAKKKLGYVEIPSNAKVVEDDIQKPAAPAKEVV